MSNNTNNNPPSVEDEFNADKRMAFESFLHREYNLSHLNVEREFAFYNAVKDGDEKTVTQMMLPLQHEGMGQLSTDRVRNLKYHLIISIALITRFCIEGGMNPEEAYSLSDIYIQQLDTFQSSLQINKLHRDAIFSFTKKMHTLKYRTPYSKQITAIVDYIYDHLHEKIELQDLSKHLNHNKTYLCDLFKKETGFTIGEYILHKKIEASQNMLKYSDYSSSDIGNYLGFASHSHFISCFKKITGITPKQYRDINYRKEFT